MCTLTAQKRSKAAAIRRMQNNALLHRVLEIEPRLKPLVEAAKKQKNEPGYNRIHAYERLKQQAETLVGWQVKNPQLKTSKSFDAVVRTIGDLLPPDDVDLYPEGKPA